ncbi:hypothetical protein ASD99_30615 [Mesorhizobium sp. Root695]|nr:hypothetical protein ASD99_30615 [Mesorhizobium sp. Root695]
MAQSGPNQGRRQTTGERGPTVKGSVQRIWAFAWKNKKTATRKDVIAFCTAEGIPTNTGSTQFSKYTKSNDAQRKARAEA